MNQVTKSNLQVGSVANTKVVLPITTIGEGSPHLAVICGVHGDETSGLLICRELVSFLRDVRPLRGAVSIITSANPLAQSIGSRVSVADHMDLNRLGAGTADGTLTERLAHKLFHFLFPCDFVVDLHEFLMDTPLMAVYTPAPVPKVDQKILRGIAAFAPRVVWAVPECVGAEAAYHTTLTAELSRRGTPAFIVETSMAAVFSAEGVRAAARGLVDVCRSVGVLDGEPRRYLPPAFDRQVKYADSSGIWVPSAELMSSVSVGNKVGELTNMDLVGRSDIFAHADGTLIQRRGAGLISTGSSLFTVGLERADVAAKLAVAAGGEGAPAGLASLILPA